MRFGILCAILGLSGCVAMNPVTMVRLATMNPLAADPGAIAVQLVLPAGVGVVEGSAAMSIETTFADGDEISERFLLENLPNDVWRVARADQELLRELQVRVITAEEADPDTASGSFSVGFEPCTLGDGPGEDATFSISIQLDHGGGFLPLVNNARVSELYEADDIATLEPCETEA